MKKFNLKLITPLILTLILQGCMPDSLTKFKKDPPKKATAAASTSTTPVVDETGAVINFDPPTKFYYNSEADSLANLKVNATATISLTIDGSLANSTVAAKFFDRCDLVTTGDAQTSSLPSGLNFSTACVFSGIPRAIKNVTTAFCSDPSYLTELSCEAAPLVWNAATSKCSIPDLKYASQLACETAFNKWYNIGDAIPYQIKMSFRNAAGVPQSIYTTVNIRSLMELTSLNYSQSDKVLLDVTLKPAGVYADIVPLLTSTSTAGAYARANTMVDSAGVVGVVKLVDTVKNNIGVNKLVAIKVASTTPFVQYGFISKVGDATKVGKVFSINASQKTLYVENISANNKYFVKNETITTNATGVGTAYTITDINENYVFQSTSMDNDNQYFSDEYGLTGGANIYEAGYPIKPLLPLTSTEINSSNGITYTISPALPCEDPADVTKCISLNATTGEITGTFPAAQAKTTYTVTATNAINSVTEVFQMGAIDSVRDLSITNKQVITVNSTALFKAGETIYQPITPPLVDVISARIIKILDSHKIAIETTNGAFLQNTSLDNGNAYLSEKAYIIPDNTCTDINYTTQATCEAALEGWSIGPVYYNVALKINATGIYTPSLSGTPVYATATGGTGVGAKAMVSDVFTAANDIIFLKYLTNTATSTATSKVFYQGDVLDSAATVLSVLNESLKVNVTSSASFNLGVDIFSNGGAGAYNYKKGTNILYLGDLSFRPAGTDFSVGDIIYNDEAQTTSTANTTITGVTHDLFFQAERGEKVVIPAFLSSGNEVIYSIAPPLPTGLSLNTKTGTITGTATYSSARKDYTLTAANFIGSSKFVFAFEARDYFKVENATTAPTFFLHKVGDSQINRKCRVNSTDLLNSATDLKALDIRCFLDVEEQDLYQIKMKLKESAGPGVCQFVEYAPFSFNSFAPVKSQGVSYRYPEVSTVSKGCQTTGITPTPDMCDGNYKYYDTDYPDCDEGYLEYNSETWVTVGMACVHDTTSDINIRVNCGGSKVNCMKGPIKDILTDAQIKQGNRAVIAESSTGYTKTFEHKSPIELAFGTNLNSANGIINNKCDASNDHANSWANKAAAIPDYKHPMGSQNPFYEFNCLDSAQEIKARIRVVVRDWNRSFRISDGIDNQSYTAPAAYMNIATADPFGSSYNDRRDWDDDYSGIGAAGYTGATTALSCANKTAPGANCIGDINIVPSQASCSKLNGASWNGICSNVTYNNSHTACLANGDTWTSGGCVFDNQAQCLFYDGTWSGDPDFAFPWDTL